MKTPPPPSASRHLPLFWYQVCSLLALIVLVAGVGGLGLVWLRQQMTDTAQRIKVVQNERVLVERRLEYLGARSAELQRPDVLRDRALAMGLVLRRPQSAQVVRLGPLAVPADPSAPTDREARPAREPFRQTFDLAVMEPVRPAGG